MVIKVGTTEIQDRGVAGHIYWRRPFSLGENECVLDVHIDDEATAYTLFTKGAVIEVTDSDRTAAKFADGTGLFKGYIERHNWNEDTHTSRVVARDLMYQNKDLELSDLMFVNVDLSDVIENLGDKLGFTSFEYIPQTGAIDPSIPQLFFKSGTKVASALRDIANAIGGKIYAAPYRPNVLVVDWGCMHDAFNPSSSLALTTGDVRNLNFDFPPREHNVFEVEAVTKEEISDKAWIATLENPMTIPAEGLGVGDEEHYITFDMPVMKITDTFFDAETDLTLDTATWNANFIGDNPANNLKNPHRIKIKITNSSEGERYVWRWRLDITAIKEGSHIETLDNSGTDIERKWNLKSPVMIHDETAKWPRRRVNWEAAQEHETMNFEIMGFEKDVFIGPAAGTRTQPEYVIDVDGAKCYAEDIQYNLETEVWSISGSGDRSSFDPTTFDNIEVDRPTKPKPPEAGYEIRFDKSAGSIYYDGTDVTPSSLTFIASLFDISINNDVDSGDLTSVAWSFIEQGGASFDGATNALEVTIDTSSATGPILLRCAIVYAGKTFTNEIGISYGRAGAGAELLSIHPDSQVFHVNILGTADPETITIEAMLKNITGTVTWYGDSGDGWVEAPLWLGIVGNTATIAYADMPAEKVKVKAVLYDLEDITTIVKVRDGTFGVTVFLTNENHTFSSDHEGAVPPGAWAEGKTQLRVFIGGVQFTCPNTTTTPPSGDDHAIYKVTSIATVEGTMGFDVAIVGDQYEVQPTSMGTDSAVIELTVEGRYKPTWLPGINFSYTKRVTYSKSKSAKDIFTGVAPAVPIGLSLSSFYQHGKAYIKAEWSANSEEDLKGYELRWSYDNSTWRNAGFTSEAELIIEVTPQGTTTVDYTVYVQVRAANLEGMTSNWSASQSQVVQRDTTAPAVPGTGSVTGGVGLIYVQWGAVADYDLNYYELQRGVQTASGGAFSSYATIATLKSRDYIDEQVDYHITDSDDPNYPQWRVYRYQVRAVDHAGNASSYRSLGDDSALQATGPDIAVKSIIANHLAVALDLAVGRKITVGSAIEIGADVGPVGSEFDGIYIVAGDLYSEISGSKIEIKGDFVLSKGDNKIIFEDAQLQQIDTSGFGIDRWIQIQRMADDSPLYDLHDMGGFGSYQAISLIDLRTAKVNDENAGLSLYVKRHDSDDTENKCYLSFSTYNAAGIASRSGIMLFTYASDRFYFTKDVEAPKVFGAVFN